MESRETRERVSRQFNWIEISTRMLRIVKNILFYRLFGHNCLIVLIDGYDRTVHRGPFQLSRDRRIFDEGPRCSGLIGIKKKLESCSLDHDWAV